MPSESDPDSPHDYIFDVDLNVEVLVDGWAVEFGPASTSNTDVTIRGFDPEFHFSDEFIESFRGDDGAAITGTIEVPLSVDVPPDDLQFLPDALPELDEWTNEALESHIEAEYDTTVTADVTIDPDWQSTR